MSPTTPSLHQFQERYAHVRATFERAQLPPGSREKILSFDTYIAARGLGFARRAKYIEVLRILSESIGKPFDAISSEDLMLFCSQLEARPISVWTKKTYKAAIKRFWRWLKGLEAPGQPYPPEVAWMSTSLPRNKKPLPRAEDLLTEEDAARMLDLALHPRDKAFVSTLWESGARIGELGNLILQDVHFDKYGAVIGITGKTGSRRVRLIQSVPYLANWLTMHPYHKQRDAPLWCNLSTPYRGRPLEYRWFNKMLRRIALQAGINKRVHPHAFRHSRATFLAKHLTEFQMNQYLGWVQGSDMPSTYVHMSGREMDDALLKLNGITPDQAGKAKQGSAPTLCPRCETINTQDSTYCRKCGTPRTVPTALQAEEKEQEAEQVLAELLQDPAVRDAVQEALIRRKLRTPLTQVKTHWFPAAGLPKALNARHLFVEYDARGNHPVDRTSQGRSEGGS